MTTKRDRKASEDKKSRNANGRSTIYGNDIDGWHGRVSMGFRDDGRPDRRHVRGKNKDEVAGKVTKLEQEREAGTIRKPGKVPSVREWLTYWLENIAAPNVRYKTAQGYGIAVNRHLIPGVGAHRMDKIDPNHFEKLYARMIKSGLEPATAHQVHRTARTAFREARKRDIITKNPFDVVKAPRVEEKEVEPFEIEEIQALMTAALARRNGVRFVLALAIGTRKGETLAFRWSWLNISSKVLRVRKQWQRQNYEHGCSNAARCAEPHHKAAPCKKPCKRHKTCPPPCPIDCTRHAHHCPQRIGGMVEVDVKSTAGRRGIRLPDQLYDLLMDHKAKQAKERELAGELWQGGDWIFTQPNGKPLDPRSDHDEWKALLADAGVRDARLHDARHTAATVLLLLGVPERAVMDFMGWSDSKMVKRYTHVVATLRDDIASRIDGFLWKTD